MVLSLMALSLISTAAPAESFPWWDTDWSDRVFLKVSENSGEALIQYGLRFELGPDDLDFSKADPQGCDLRFIGGEDELSYWVQEWDAEDENAVIWLSIPYLNAGETTTIAMYYSNPDAVCGYGNRSELMYSSTLAKTTPIIKVFEKDPLAERSENPRSLLVSGMFLMLFVVLLGSRFYLRRRRIPGEFISVCRICGANISETRRRCPVCGNKL